MKRYRVIFLCLVFVFSLLLCACGSSTATTIAESTKDHNRTIVVGIAWKCDGKPKVYESTISAIETAGAKAVVLDKVVSSELAYNDEGMLSDSMIDSDGDLTDKAAQIVKNKNYEKSNVSDAIAGIDAIIFLGGEDISPSLLLSPESVKNGNDKDTINPTRDVSDYLAMSYCLDNDIPILAICRGMQMLAVVSGGSIIQDLPEYYNEQGASYNYHHRMERDATGNIADFTPHDVDITDKDSIIYGIVNSTLIEKVPSWHHQAVDITGVSSLKVTGTTTYNGIAIPEIIERTDKSYVIGYQFHPEAVVDKHNNQGNEFDFTSIITVNKLFDSLVENAKY